MKSVRTGVSDEPNSERYRSFKTDHVGAAQLTVLETALCPLNARPTNSPSIHETHFFYTDLHVDLNKPVRKRAEVRVKADRGLQPSDEYYLCGMLFLVLHEPQTQRRLLATPYWLLQHLGLATGGRQYQACRDSLERLAGVTYFCDAFYNPLKKCHERASFHFLNLFLPQDLASNRPWDIRFDPDFLKFCGTMGGKLLFDLELLRQFDFGTRRLFLKLHDRFWRAPVARFVLRHLATNGLGLADTLLLRDLKAKVTAYARKLLEAGVIRLPDGVHDLKELFTKKAKGVYTVRFHRGPYFDRPRPIPARSTMTGDLKSSRHFQPLTDIGFDERATRHIIHNYKSNIIDRWAEHTLIAMEDPRGFPGFKKTPMAYCMDGIKNNRPLPDWHHEFKKQEERRRSTSLHRSCFRENIDLAAAYDAARAAAFDQCLHERIGDAAYRKAYDSFWKLQLLRLNPHQAAEAAKRDAIRHFQLTGLFQFPDRKDWMTQNT